MLQLLMASVQLDSALLVLFLLFVVSCLVIVRNLRAGRKDVWRRRAMLPSPPALPIIGNLHQLGRGSLHRKLQALARRHGPLFQLRLGTVPALVVSSASMAEEVLKTQDHVFCGRPQQRTARGLLYDCRDIGFSPYGERWRQLRRIAVVHLLSTKRVDSFRVVREEEVSSMVAKIEATSARVNVSELVVGLSYTIISRAAFGNRLGGLDPRTVKEMMNEFAELLQTIAVSDIFPGLGWVDWAMGLDSRIKRTASKVDDVLEKTLEEHEKCSENHGEPADLLDDLIALVSKGGDGLTLDWIDVKGLILDLFVAGTDTTSKSLEWAMAELIKNPKEMDKVQAEVRQVAGTTQGVREEQLGSMPRVQAVLKESMRLHAPVPLLIPREVIEDTRIHGYDIPAKTRVIVNAWAIGRDEESWENAKEFLPERFLQGPIDYNGKDFRFIPFSAGRRGCPGATFAIRLAELALANFLYHFDWALPQGQEAESFEAVESDGISAGLKSPLILVAKSPA